jgi:TolB-like protein
VIRRQTRTFLALLAVASVLAACNTVPTRRGSSVEASPAVRIEAASPTDVAVLPVENASGSKRVPAKMLRDAFASGLVARRYSPLATEFVDQQVVDASFRPGSLREDAVLRVTVEGWDEKLWDTNTAVTVKMHAQLLDSKNGGAELWSGRIDRRFDLNRERNRFATEEPLRRLLCENVVAELLTALPARAARPGRATDGS